MSDHQEKLRRLLQRLFIRQAQDVAARIRPESLEVPDLSGWIQVTVDAVRPILLDQFRQGMLKAAARIARKVGAVPQFQGGVPPPAAAAIPVTGSEPLGMRTYRPGNASIFGQEDKAFTLRSNRWLVIKAPRKDKPAVSIDFDLFNPKVLLAVDRAAFTFCTETMETATSDLRTALDGLRRLLAVGLPRGDAIRRLSDDVRTIFADPMRAFRIATTETSRAIHGGQLLAAVESGVVTGRTWLASADACELCLELNGKTVGLNEPFWIDRRGGPYAVCMHPPLHPHCFCDVTEEI